MLPQYNFYPLGSCSILWQSRRTVLQILTDLVVMMLFNQGILDSPPIGPVIILSQYRLEQAHP